MPDLRFFSNEGDIEEGLGDAGIETFRDSPYASVARECAQNSADAKVKNPVTVSFEMINLSASEFPSLNSFRSSIDCCLEKANNSNIEKEVEFFENAKKSLASESIRILKISDSNTRGLVGPCIPGTPFHGLLKGSGVSVKDAVTSGGSFGIGKNAAFAISDIQTVFYSTRYSEPQTGNHEFHCQAKSILVSHTDAGGNNNLATGYWGEVDFKPVTNSDEVPEWLKREEIGTSVYCIACRDADNWEAGLAASLVQNFFCAIHKKEICFTINNGALEINHSTLMSLFGSSDIRQAAADNGHGEDFEFSRNLYECLKAVETKEEIITIPDLGKVAVKILVREGLPKRVSFIRNGMYITDNLENFGEKFRRFPLYKDFVALVEPVDADGITHFKKLENPKHDGFSSERLSDTQKRNAAARVMKKLGKLIRDAIKSQSLEKPKDSVSIDELSEFFADEIDPEKVQDPNAIEENPETYKYKPVKRKPPREEGPGDGKEGAEGGSGSNEGDGGDSGGSGSGSGSGSGGSGNKSGGKVIPLRKTRNLIAEGGPRKRQLILTAEETVKAAVTVLAEGLNKAEKLEIVGADMGTVSAGSVELDLEKGTKLKLVIEFPEEYDGPIEVYARSIAEAVAINED